jgi:hypothetical protein
VARCLVLRWRAAQAAADRAARGGPARHGAMVHRPDTNVRSAAERTAAPMMWAAEQPLKVGEARSHQRREGSGRRAWLAERDMPAVDLFDFVRPTHRRRARAGGSRSERGTFEVDTTSSSDTNSCDGGREGSPVRRRRTEETGGRRAPPGRRLLAPVKNGPRMGHESRGEGWKRLATAVSRSAGLTHISGAFAGRFRGFPFLAAKRTTGLEPATFGLGSRRSTN